MKYVMAITVALLAVLATGCGQGPVVSLRPLYLEKEKLAAEPRLEGSWTAYSLSGSGVSAQSDWHITIEDKGCYQAERVKKDEEKREERDEKEIYYACLVTLDDKLFFDAELSQKKVGMHMVNATDMSPNMAPVHELGRLWAQSDFIRMARLNPEWIKQNVPEESRVTAGSSIILTASTQQLRDFMAQHAEDNDATSAAWFLCRPM